MKYRHLCRLVRNNPDITEIEEHIGPPKLREWVGIHETERKRYIEEVVKFVDFRDFAKLDLDAPLISKRDVVLNGHNNPSREEIRYAVRYHVNGKTGYCDPIRGEKVHGEFETHRYKFSSPTMRSLLQNRARWFLLGMEFAEFERAIVLDTIVKITRIWDGDWDRYSSETVEIYRVPEHLKPLSVWEQSERM